MAPRRTVLLLAACLALPAGTAQAHPHVWVSVKSEMRYQPDGRIAGVSHFWTFDQAYSAYVTQGLDTNKDGKLSPDELKELARENTTSLVDFEYFTVIKANGAKQSLGEPRDYGMVFENGAATLSFFLPLASPAQANRVLSVEIYDPTYFVDFRLADGDDAVRLAGAPKGCAVTITRPKTVDPTDQQRLGESFFEALSSASNFGAQFANRALVACP